MGVLSDEAFVAVCALLSDPEIRNDPDTFAMAEKMICNAAMDRRKARLTSNLDKITKRMQQEG
jgi:hypothetical protein